MFTNIHWLLLALLALFIAPLPAGAAPQVLVAADGAPRDAFGSVVAANAELIAVTAHGVSVGEADGPVRVFALEGDGWRQVAALTGTFPGEDEFFGGSLAMDDHWILVGAPDADVSGLSDAGAVYVFERNGSAFEWSLATRLAAADPSPGARFGTSVAIDGARMIVTALLPGSETNVPTGSAYVFEHDAARAQWQQVARLRPPGERPSLYGVATDIAGARAVVSEPNSATDGTGRIFIYEWDGSGWRGNAELSPLLPGNTINFPGARVAMEDDLLAFTEDFARAEGETNSPGRIHLYEYDGGGWSEAGLLRAPEAHAREFGWAMAFGNGVVAATVTQDDTIHLFRDDGDAGWRHVAAVTPPNFTSNARGALALTAGHLIAGANGQVNVFRLADILPAQSPADGGTEQPGDGQDDDNGGNDGAGNTAGNGNAATDRAANANTEPGGGGAAVLLPWLALLAAFRPRTGMT